MRDFSSHTEADAGAWERAHGDAGAYDDGRPTRAEVDAEDAPQTDAAWAYHQGPDTTERGIRCAHCKGRHATVADVHWCSDLQAEARAEAEAEQAADVAYARDREAMAERGTWFGPQTEADSWGE
jgi:hypothetical protein